MFWSFSQDKQLSIFVCFEIWAHRVTEVVHQAFSSHGTSPELVSLVSYPIPPHEFTLIVEDVGVEHFSFLSPWALMVWGFGVTFQLSLEMFFFLIILWNCNLHSKYSQPSIVWGLPYIYIFYISKINLNSDKKTQHRVTFYQHFIFLLLCNEFYVFGVFSPEFSFTKLTTLEALTWP